MLSRIIHFVAILLAATLEISLSLWLGEAMPGLVLAGILALSLGGDVIDSLWWIVLGGLLLDSMNSFGFGLHILIFSLMSAALILLNRQIFHRPPVGIALVIFMVAALLWQLVFALLSSHLSWQILLSAILTACLATAAYRLIIVVGRRREVISLG